MPANTAHTTASTMWCDGCLNHQFLNSVIPDRLNTKTLHLTQNRRAAAGWPGASHTSKQRSKTTIEPSSATTAQVGSHLVLCARLLGVTVRLCRTSYNTMQLRKHCCVGRESPHNVSTPHSQEPATLLHRSRNCSGSISNSCEAAKTGVQLSVQAIVWTTRKPDAAVHVWISHTTPTTC
jgi:hypothetical protein